MKRILSLLCCVAVLLALANSGASAASVASKLDSSDASLTLDVLSASSWTKGTGISAIKNTDAGSVIIYPSAEKVTGEIEFSRTFEKAVRFSEVNEVCFEATVTANADTASVTLTVYGENGVYSDTAQVKCGSERSIYFKFPETVSDDVVKLQLSVSADGIPPESFEIFSAYADNFYSYSYVELYDTLRFIPVEGEVAFSERAVVLTSSGTAAVEAILAKKPSQSGASVEISVGSTGSGIIYVENTEDGTVYQSALYSGTNTYVFFLSGIPESFRLGFVCGDGTGNAKISLSSMKVTDLGEANYASLGALTSCTYKNGVVTASGKITSDAAVTYMNTQLGLFRVSLDGQTEKEPLAKIKISTVFELSAKEEENTSLCRYMVAIIDGEEIHPVSTPVFATSYSGSSATHSQTSVGLLRPESDVAFETDAGIVMLDVLASRLLADENSSSAVIYSHNEKLYGINSEYFSEIRHDTHFYNDLGYTVYLRLSVDGNTNVYNSHTLENMHAALSYLAENAEGVDGYALLSDYDTENNSIERASYGAVVLGSFSETVRRINSASEIYYCVSQNENVFTSHLAHYAKLLGVQGISAVYNLESEADMALIRASVDSSGFRHVILTASDADVCKTVYENASKAGIYAILLDAENGFDAEAFKSISTRRSEKNSDLSHSADIKGEATLWNFRDNYSTFGWISGGGFTSPETVKSASGRALRATLEGGTGILLCRIDEGMNLTDADGIFLSLGVKNAETAQIDLIVGYANSRTVYSGAAEEGEVKFYAELEKGESVEYIAISLKGEAGLSVHVSEVGAYSSSLESDALQNSVKAPDATAKEQMNIYYVFGGAAVVITAIIFILLTRKKEDEKEEEEQ